jgi:sigma-B regulation protein RsbU (phosphoserine phosphatase)
MKRTSFIARNWWRYLLLALLFLGAAGYYLRAMEFRFPYWFHLQKNDEPFYLAEPGLANPAQPHRATFLRTQTIQAGLKDGDIVLSVNGKQLTGTRVYGEEVARSRPGDSMLVTVLRRQQNAPPETMSFSVPLHAFTWNWKTEISFGALMAVLPFFCVLLGFWVTAARPRDPLAWLVLALMLSYEVFFYPAPQTWGPWKRDLATAFRTGGDQTLPIWLLLFGIYFPEPFPATSRWSRWRWLKWVLIIPLSIFACGEVITALGELERSSTVRFLERLPALLGVLQLILFYLAMGSAILCLAAKYRAGVSPDSKRRLRLLLAAMAAALAPILLLKLISAILGKQLEKDFPQWLWLPSYLLLFLFPVALAYVIVVHRALDVRVVLRQGLQYALARNGVRIMQVLVTVAVFVAAGRLVGNTGRTPVEKVALFALGLGVIMGIRRGADRLRGFIDRRFFREAYDAERVLSELSDQVRSIVEPRSLLETVAARLSETLHVPQVAVMLDAGSPFQPAYALGYDSVSDVVFPQESATVKVLRSQREPLRLYLDNDDDDPDSWLNRNSGSTAQERAALARLGTNVLLPLTAREKLLGFISLGAKKSEVPFTGNDLRLLKSVANQTGLALENAQLLAAITEEVAQRERLNREVEIAREVQERLFPQELPVIRGLDYCGGCRPALGVGGDYYDFLALPEGQLGLAIGDVSGKGIGAALLMASLEASLRAEATRAPDDLALLVSHVNRLVYQASTSNRFATLFYAQYDPARRSLIYVNAGHNAPMLFRQQAGEWNLTRLSAGGTVVGLFESFGYTQESIDLKPGDLLVAFTDGISETMNTAEEEWGEERFVESIKACAGLPAAGILSSIMQAADVFAGGAKQHDDMTLVVLQVTE